MIDTYEAAITHEDIDWWNRMVDLLDAAEAKAEHDAEVAECCGGRDKWCGHYRHGS